jgi:general secretion pathway protein D
MIVQAPPGAMPAPGGSPSTATITVELPSANVITLSGSATVVAEPNSNSLIVTATPENAAIIRGLVAQLDQAPPQVLIEAIIAEVALDKDSKLGFEWNWTENPAFGNSSLIGEAGADFGLSAITSGLSYAITGANWSSLLKALKTDKNVTILSTPRIFTSNNRPAEINISTQTPYVSSVVTTDNTQTFAVEYLDVGVILQVTPQISPDGMVTMDVTQEASELLGFENLGGNARAPTVANRSAQATVRVMDGQTVILGGIISSNHTRTVNKVPLLGDLPLVGSLFRHSDVSNTKSELLVFLTPRVVRTPEEATALAAEQRDESIAPVPPLPGIDDVETPDADDMAPEADAPEE